MEGKALSPDQEHLLVFMHERFLTMQEAAIAFGGEEGIEAMLNAEEFAKAIRQSGYARPSEQLFSAFSGGQNRMKVRDLLRFIIRLPEELKALDEPPSRSSPKPFEEELRRSLSEALRLLAEERRERLEEKAEMQRCQEELRAEWRGLQAPETLQKLFEQLFEQEVKALEVRWSSERALKDQRLEGYELQEEIQRLQEALQRDKSERQVEVGELHSSLDKLTARFEQLTQASESLRAMEPRLEAEGLRMAVQDVREELSREVARRSSSWEEMRKELQQEALLREELVASSGQGLQRLVSKVADELRGGLRQEALEREEQKGRLSEALEALRAELHTAQGQLRCSAVDVEEARMAQVAQATEQRGALEGLLVRFQYMEAALSEEAALREEDRRRFRADLAACAARAQDDKALGEHAAAKISQELALQAQSMDQGLRREQHMREETQKEAFLVLQKQLKALELSSEEQRLASRCQQQALELQQERSERLSALREHGAGLARLERSVKEQEELRSQAAERLGKELEALQELQRGLRSGQEELQLTSQALAEELRSTASRETTLRQGQLELLERELKELRMVLQQETQHREVAVKSLASELLAEVQAREEMSGRERRSILEEVSSALREQRKLREEEEKRTQQRLLEALARLGEEREQRTEALRVERSRLQQLSDELQTSKKASQLGLEKLQLRLQSLEAVSEQTEKELRALSGQAAQERRERTAQLQQQEELLKSLLEGQEERLSESGLQLGRLKEQLVEATLRLEQQSQQCSLGVRGLEGKIEEMGRQWQVESQLRGRLEAELLELQAQGQALRQDLGGLFQGRKEDQAALEAVEKALRDENVAFEETWQGLQELRHETGQVAEESRRLSREVEALMERAAPEQFQELHSGLAQLERRWQTEEVQRQQVTNSVQRALDEVRTALLDEVKERRQRDTVALQELQEMKRSGQVRDEKAEVSQRQLQRELLDLRERMGKVLTREAALQLVQAPSDALNGLQQRQEGVRLAVTEPLRSREEAPEVLGKGCAAEQEQLRQDVLELQARLTSSEARQKVTEERTVNMLDAIMNGLMSNES